MFSSIADLLTFVSIMVAIVFGIIGYRQNQLAQKKSHTVNLLENFSSNETLATADFQMTRLINNDKKLDGYEIEDETDSYVINLLDYYEFLATSYIHGVLNQDILLHIRGGAMSRAHFVCEKYIDDRRKMLNAPNLYRNYENLVIEYRRRDMGL